MKMIIPLLLLTLSGCSTTKIKTEYLTIPEDFLQCEKLSIIPISDGAYESAEQGNFRPLVEELVEDRLHIEEDHTRCVNNAADAREFQERMTDE